MKNFLGLLLFALSLPSYAQYNICQETRQMMPPPNPYGNIDHNARSDTFDIQHYDVTIDVTRLPNKTLKGVATIVFTPLLPNLDQLNLDLQSLGVDSVIHKGNSLVFNHNDTLLRIEFPSSLPLSVNDTLTVFYQGVPDKDPANWGGVHHDAYVYNLGVGFGSNPHVFGRAWHPCFDNFRERATYDLNIICRQPRKAYANGTFQGSQILSGDTVIFRWSLAQEIPTYLASWSVANYSEVHQTYQGLNDTIPIVLAALSGDTVNLKSSFQNLKSVLMDLETKFGPYQWDKVGYTMTTVGAMEHATSIHYPISTVDGTTSAEDLMVHELAHHWFGNLVTCQTAEEMWINEGWAEFISHIYTEALYGRNRYEEIVQDNAHLVLERAHLDDGGFLSLTQVPWAYTYGTTVYQKGAMVAHNLRGYLGDSIFFDGIKQVLSQNAYSDLSINDFKDDLINATGVDLNPFFNDWVNNPGFDVIRVDSVRCYPTTGLNQVVVGLSNASYGTSNRHSGIPLNIALVDSLGNVSVESFNWGGNDTSITWMVPTWITNASIYPDNEVLTGMTRNTVENFTTGSLSLNRTKANLFAGPNTQIDNMVIEYYYSGPKSTLPQPKFRVHPSRYWRIMGSIPGKEATLNLPYRGFSNTDPEFDLLKAGEDSIRLLYRKDAGSPWIEYPYYSKQGGSNLDKKGVMVLSRIEVGDYAFANTNPSLSLPEIKGQGFMIFPNPTEGKITIAWSNNRAPEGSIQLLDLQGKLIRTYPTKAESRQEIEIPGKGFFLVRIDGETRKIIVE